MTKLIFKTEDLYKKTALLISKSINKIIDSKKQVVIGLAGGNSISKTLDELYKLPVDWNHVHIFMVDERIVPITHPQSNFKMIFEKLSRIIPKENFHPFNYNSNKNDLGIAEYNKSINSFKNEFDIVIVSSGEDGHIGSLFPKHTSIFNESESYIIVENSPKPPANRISAPKKMIINSRIGFLFIVGENKINAYEKFIDEQINYVDCPSKLINEISENYIVISDNLIGGKNE